MMDITPYQDFLSSLSRVTPYCIEIWKPTEPIFSPEPLPEGAPERKHIEDLMQRVIREGAFQHAVLADDYTLFGVPLRVNEDVIGTLIARGRNGDRSTEDMEAFLVQTAELIQENWSFQKETEELAEELTQSFEDLHLYSRIAVQIKALRLSGSRLRSLLEELLETMRADLAFCRLPDYREFDMAVAGSKAAQKLPRQDEFVKNLLEAIPNTVTIDNEDCFIIEDSSSKPEFARLHTKSYRFLAVRVQNRDNQYGWLGLVAFNVKEIFRRSELGLLGSMAEQIAMVIANTDLYRDMERFVINVVRSLVQAIEAKDFYTRGHSERVNRYCMLMADVLDMASREKEDLHWASILHDIGKIGIPEIILNKPEHLDNEEYELIKNHSQKGYGILKPIEQLAGSLPAILYHHERFDGKGYPTGLSGEAIPLIARIIAVADTFDALVTDRAYRKGITPHAAMFIMRNVAGSQLDPKLFRVFQDAYLKDAAAKGKQADGTKGR